MGEICDYIESNFLLYQRQDSIKINDLITYQSFSNFFHYTFSQQQSKVYPVNKKITRQVYWQEIPFG
jgi:capsule polysaccharide export protein KpsE/RkpR